MKEVTCDGAHVTVRLNKEIVQDFHTTAEPDLAGRPQEGCLGLQDHGNPMLFRKIRLKPLPPASAAAP